MYDEGDMNKEKREERREQRCMFSWFHGASGNEKTMLSCNTMLCNEEECYATKRRRKSRRKELGAKTSRQDMKRRKITRTSRVVVTRQSTLLSKNQGRDHDDNVDMNLNLKVEP